MSGEERKYLCISVRFLSPIYCGSEWPPSPARLFQALVAACHHGISRDLLQEFREVLLFLQKPPRVIVASEGKKPTLELHRSFPTNQFERAGGEIKKLGFYPLGVHSSYRHLPRESKIPRDFYEPRPFHPFWLEGDRNVHYLWDLSGGEGMEKRIKEIARRIVALGWGTDMVIGEGKILKESEISKLSGLRYILDPTNRAEMKLAVPNEGFLEEVEECFEVKWGEHKGRIDLRPSPDFRSYRCEEEIAGPIRQWVGFKLCAPEDRETMKAFSPHRWAEIVGWLRHAVAEAFKEKKSQEWVRQKILGHPEQGEHVHFIPVPSVGQDFSDGFIRRVMICWSPEIDMEKEEMNMLEDVDLVSEKGEREACLKPERKFFERFIGPEKEWKSVSPVILHGYDFRRGKFSPTKCHLLILQAFKNSGYNPELIEDFSLQKAPLVPGTLHVSCYHVPNHLDNQPRYHLEVKFRKPILGPVVVGRGRFYGLGLFLSAKRVERVFKP